MKKRIVAFDTETTGLNTLAGDKPFIFSFTEKNDKDECMRSWSYVFDVTPKRGVIYSQLKIEEIRRILEDETITKIGHNINFDIDMASVCNINVRGAYYDTIVMAHCENSGRSTYALKPLSKLLLKFPDDDEKELKADVIRQRRIAKKAGWKIADSVEADYWLSPKLADVYAKKDTERTMGLYWHFCKRMETDSNYAKLVSLEMKLLDVVRKMKQKGVCIDQERLLELDRYYNKLIIEFEIRKSFLGYAKLNPRSNKQMKKVFYEDLKMEPIYKRRKTKNGVESSLTCDSKALKIWAEDGVDLAKTLVNIKTAGHELSAFVEPFKELSSYDGALHPNYITCGPLTGRISCGKPNLMNISNTGIKHGDVALRIRELFIPRENHVLYFPDYSQVEVWLAAYISKDNVMMESLANGLDMHGQFSEQFFYNEPDYEEKKEMYRKRTKIATFATLYGGGAGAIMETAGLTYGEAAEFQNYFRNHYKGLSEYAKDLALTGERLGFIVDNFGRNYPVVKNSSYKALNYMIQGSAAGVMKRALINLNDLFTYKWKGCHLLLTIHDEVCIEVPNKLHSKRLMRDIIKAMQGDLHQYFDMPHPFDVSMAWTDTRWSEKKEIEL